MPDQRDGQVAQAQPQDRQPIDNGVLSYFIWILELCRGLVNALPTARSAVASLAPIVRTVTTGPVLFIFNLFRDFISTLIRLCRDPSSFYEPMPPAMAQRELVSSMFWMALLLGVTWGFPPYLTVKRGVIAFCDYYQGRRGTQSSWMGVAISCMEWFMTFIVSLRIVSALFSATRPARPPQVPITGIQIPTTQPPSSSLRYADCKLRPIFPSPPPRPTQNSGQGQGSGYATPTRPSHTGPNSHFSSTPLRSSPLSSSTSRVLNISSSAQPRQRTGLYFDSESSSSPSKVALRQSQSGSGGGQEQQQQQQQQRSSLGGQGQQQGQGQGQGMDQGFVIVDKADKDWADNVWKGVRGKRSSGLFSK